VHGEYKQLKKHAITAANVGVPEKNIYIGENGDNIILSRDSLTMGEGVTAGAVMVDGLGVGDVGNVVLRDRRHLSQDGLVIIVATVDSATGELLAGPDIVSRGFVYVREADELIGGARDIVRDVLDKCRGEHVREWGNVKMRVREAVSAYMYRRTKRSPMILPVLMEV
ncbi:MAG: RNase J family beta-CASP ribonuclease, partial [Oscillospiraceae bacterium]